MSRLRMAVFVAAGIATICWSVLVAERGRLTNRRLAAGEPKLLCDPMITVARPLQGAHDQPITTPQVHLLDGQVRATTALVPIALAATSIAGQTGQFEITQVFQDNVAWSVTPQLNVVHLIADGKVILTGTGAAAEKITAQVNGQAVEATPELTQPAGFWVVSIPITGTGEQRVAVSNNTDPANVQTDEVRLRTPSGDALKIQQPTMTRVSNNAFATPSTPIPGSVSVYGGYLRLAGERYLGGTQLRFAVFKKRTDSAVADFVDFASLKGPILPRQDAIWDAELELPRFIAGDKGYILVLATSSTGDLHRYSRNVEGERIDFVIARNVDSPFVAPSTPTITGQTPDGSGLHRLKNREFQVAGTVSGDAAMLADSRLVILLNGNPQEIKDINVKPGNNWSTTVTVPTDGAYRVQVRTMLGNLDGKESGAALVRVRTSGPSVDSVVAANSLREVTVKFDEPIVNPTAANLNTIFELRNSKDAKVAAKTDLLPTFDVSSNSLTLVYGDVAPEVYTFTVQANVTNLFGLEMGKKFETKLFRPIGAEEPTTSRGITGPKGPNVVFPEYTNPRPFIDGFNPSDHVETRVSRLYYFRDAHRVAQIINRDVESYNRAAVSMQQQLADKSRQVADQATDDRRAKERKAVEAAQKTREAERELNEAESLSISSANQAAQAAADLQRNEAILRDTTLPADRRAEIQANTDNLRNVVARLESVVNATRQQAAAARDKVEHLRETESQAAEQSQASQAVEDRAREDQFRREVAAANVDPDTYAPGKPSSKDPVRQVSVSVIGEGLIQLRGPIKGINEIRTMINQIDAPVGQVRVAVHTVQINGEKGDRMEVVANKIQRYIDHSRFLTLQSAEMLRKAIVQVAAQKAAELGGIPGITQEERDRKYLDAFFGADFIHELEVMDSEFLMTGNKLLSLHSMDSTSLASAMFIMALAKNTTRMEIVQTFEGMMASELPTAEQNYFEAGLTCDGKHKLFDKHCKRDDFQLLSNNARFQSIRGMFNVDVADDDTMTPLQREFVRLAQIFKSQLIVEMELKQRIMERSVIEERLGNREKDLRDARVKEESAIRRKSESNEAVKKAQRTIQVATQPIQARAHSLREQAVRSAQTADLSRRFIAELLGEFLSQATKAPLQDYHLTFETLEADLRSQGNKARATDNRKLEAKYAQAEKNILATLDTIRNEMFAPLSKAPTSVSGRLVDAQKRFFLSVTSGAGGHPDIEALPAPKTTTFVVALDKDSVRITLSDGKVTIAAGRHVLTAALGRFINQGDEIQRILELFEYNPTNGQDLKHARTILKILTAKPVDEFNDEELLDNLHRSMTMLELYVQLTRQVSERSSSIVHHINLVVADLSADGASAEEIYRKWVSVEEDISRSIGPMLKTETRPLFEAASRAFQDLLAANLEYQFAAREAEASRRPLDHKKFLDMLVDEMEDKNIELLEGVRAHTANIDAYIKRLMTSLDDDFNTQFYYPTFRKVREASQMYDVQLGQVDTTNVLANNRSFAKVSPQATMEFDLPKRDILINEAMNSAKAMVNDFGALAQDPTFLAMAQLKSGQPTSSPVAGATGGQSTVRNVLPGLSTDTAESVLSQQGPGGAKFGAAMESLIPDPAIYKFETGTGWEIRPVIQPDGQALVFHFNYMYTTNIREPVRADEKHLGRVKRHFVDTDVQLSNFELREISRYTVALKASRTSRGVPLLEDLPLIGGLWRPLPSAESSLQQNIIMGQSTIFPTLFDLMGLRWAPVVADLDPLRLSNDEFIVRNRRRALMNRVFDQSSSQVDGFLRIPEGERRMDLYRSQETIPGQHPNGYQGPGANLRDSPLQEGYAPSRSPESQFIPGASREGSPYLQRRRENPIEMESPGSPAAHDPGRVVPDVEVLQEDEGATRPLRNSLRREPMASEAGVAPASYSVDLEPRPLRVEPPRYEPRVPNEPRNVPRPLLQRLPKTDGSVRTPN